MRVEGYVPEDLAVHLRDPGRETLGREEKPRKVASGVVIPDLSSYGTQVIDAVALGCRFS
jgi:hypothetical protein